MRRMHSVAGAMASAAMLAGSVAPAAAQARPYGYDNGGYGHGYGNRHHHRNKGIGAGEVIAGIAVIGIIAAIASAASKSNIRTRSTDGYRGIDSEDQAAEACAIRAEQRYGNGARAVIDDVLRTRDGYAVRGSIETRGNWSDDQRFDCSVRYGQIEDVRFGGGYTAWRGS